MEPLKMSRLLEEVREWNTPIVGAYLLWRFSTGYSQKHPNGAAPVAILHFIASAILTNGPLSEIISGRRPNLESYVRSFHENKQSDILACLHQRIMEKRTYTMNAIDIAVSSGFLAWDCEQATLHPRSTPRAKRGGRKLSETIVSQGNKAEQLGNWFAAHDIQSIASYLGVVL